jgi:hypothetical protein
MSGISAYRTGITDNSAGSISVGTTYTGTKEARLAALVKPYMSTGSFFEAGRNHVGDIRDQGIAVTGADLDELAWLNGSKTYLTAEATAVRATDSGLTPNREYFDFTASANTEVWKDTSADIHPYGQDSTWIAVINPDSAAANYAIFCSEVYGTSGGDSDWRTAFLLAGGKVELQNKVGNGSVNKDSVTDATAVTAGSRNIIWGSYKHSNLAAAVGKSTSGTAGATATFASALVPASGAQTGFQVGRASTATIKMSGGIYMMIRLNAFYSDIPKFVSILDAIDDIWDCV